MITLQKYGLKQTSYILQEEHNYYSHTKPCHHNVDRVTRCKFLFLFLCSVNSNIPTKDMLISLPITFLKYEITNVYFKQIIFSNTKFIFNITRANIIKFH